MPVFINSVACTSSLLFFVFCLLERACQWQRHASAAQDSGAVFAPPLFLNGRFVMLKSKLKESDPGTFLVLFDTEFLSQKNEPLNPGTCPKLALPKWNYGFQCLAMSTQPYNAVGRLSAETLPLEYNKIIFLAKR